MVSSKRSSYALLGSNGPVDFVSVYSAGRLRIGSTVGLGTLALILVAPLFCCWSSVSLVPAFGHVADVHRPFLVCIFEMMQPPGVTSRAFENSASWPFPVALVLMLVSLPFGLFGLMVYQCAPEP